MNKPKIAWITFNAFLDTDLYIVRELKKQYQILWYVVKSGNDRYEYLRELEDICADGDLELQLIECGSRLRSPACILSFWKILKHVRRSGCSLVYTSMAGAPFFVPVLRLISPLDKTIVAIHNVHVPKGGNAARFFKLYTGFTIRFFSRFQTFSRSQYRQLQERAPGKSVFYAPFILKDFGPPTAQRTDERVTFLNFGNIRPYKRLDVLIEATQRAYERTGIALRVIIAGHCENWDSYQRLIRYPELFDIRLGRVDNNEIPNLFCESDYFVAPYQDIAQSGSSVVAINYGVPVIASRLPAFEEYIVDGRNGFLMNPADPDDLANILERILRNHDLLSPVLKRGMLEIRDQSFSTETVVKQYKEMLDGILSEKQAT